MCLGVPMQVVAVTGDAADCRRGAEIRRVSTVLLDAPPVPGDWLLIHVATAIRAIDAEEARLILDALAAVDAAAHGAPFEHLLADLIDREPKLPAHLRG